MALYTLKELENKLPYIIRYFSIEDDYKVVSTEQFNKRESETVVTNGRYTVRIITRCNRDSFIIIFVAKHNKDHKLDFEKSCYYYKSHDDVYADSKEEAYNERQRYISKCYSDMHLTGKFPETYTETSSMSGGAFNYEDGRLNDLHGMVAKEIGYIEYCANDSEYEYNPKTLEYMKAICSDLGKLAKALHSLDWFVSGDTSEEKFIADYENLYMKKHDTVSSYDQK